MQTCSSRCLKQYTMHTLNENSIVPLLLLLLIQLQLLLTVASCILSRGTPSSRLACDALHCMGTSPCHPPLLPRLLPEPLLVVLQQTWT